MNILGVGPLELLFIFLIALIILGPKDIGKAGLTIGRWLRRLMTSDTWRTIQGTSKELKNLPNRLMREAGLDDLKDQFPTEKELRDAMGYDEIEDTAKKLSTDLSDWTTPGQTILPPTKPTTSKTANKPTPSTTNATKTEEKPADTDWSTPRSRPKPLLEDTVDETHGDNGNLDGTIPLGTEPQKPTTSYPPPIDSDSELSETNKN